MTCRDRMTASGDEPPSPPWIDGARALGSDSFDDTERALRRYDPSQLQPRLFEERGKLRFGPLASTPRICEHCDIE